MKVLIQNLLFNIMQVFVRTHVYSNLMLLYEAEGTTVPSMKVIGLWCMLLNNLIGS